MAMALLIVKVYKKPSVLLNMLTDLSLSISPKLPFQKLQEIV